MSITLSLATPAERAAALAALSLYVQHLDGDTKTLPLFPARIATEDNPEVGVVTPPAQTEVLVIPSATAAFAPPVPNPVAVAGYQSAPPAPPEVGLEVDSKGVVWSAELHAGNKSKNKDGSWRAKRNASGATDDAPEAPVPPPAAPVVAAPVAPPVAPPAAAPAAAGVPTTAQEFTKAIMPMIQAGKLTAVQVTEACTQAGVANLPALSANPAAVPVVWANLQVALLGI